MKTAGGQAVYLGKLMTQMNRETLEGVVVVQIVEGQLAAAMRFAKMLAGGVSVSQTILPEIHLQLVQKETGRQVTTLVVFAVIKKHLFAQSFVL
jgi:hypothetical protein